MAQFSSRPRRPSKATTLVAGSLCAAGLALFIAGAWAGVTDLWPVRFPLQLIEGRLKPISMMPEWGLLRWIAPVACWTIRTRSKSNVPTRIRRPRSSSLPGSPTPRTAVLKLPRRATRSGPELRRRPLLRGRLASSGLEWVRRRILDAARGPADRIRRLRQGDPGSRRGRRLQGRAMGLRRRPERDHETARGGPRHAVSPPTFFGNGYQGRILGPLVPDGCGDTFTGETSRIRSPLSLRAEGVDAPIYVSKATRLPLFPGLEGPNLCPHGPAGAGWIRSWD